MKIRERQMNGAEAVEYLTKDLMLKLKTENFTHINRAITEQMQQQELFVQFHLWLRANGAIYDQCLEYPVAFSPEQYCE